MQKECETRAQKRPKKDLTNLHVGKLTNQLSSEGASLRSSSSMLKVKRKIRIAD